MLLSDPNGDKPEIDYPCDWGYKIICRDGRELEDQLLQKLEQWIYLLVPSRQSKKGSFSSFNLTVRVENENQRLEIHEYLKSLDTVKMVL